MSHLSRFIAVGIAGCSLGVVVANQIWRRYFLDYETAAWARWTVVHKSLQRNVAKENAILSAIVSEWALAKASSTFDVELRCSQIHDLTAALCGTPCRDEDKPDCTWKCTMKLLQAFLREQESYLSELAMQLPYAKTMMVLSKGERNKCMRWNPCTKFWLTV